jgi:hypothetical protein
VAMRRTSAQRWEEAAPLIHGWGLAKGYDYGEAKAGRGLFSSNSSRIALQGVYSSRKTAKLRWEADLGREAQEIPQNQRHLSRASLSAPTPEGALHRVPALLCYQSAGRGLESLGTIAILKVV